MGEVPREGCDCTESGHQTKASGSGTLGKADKPSQPYLQNLLLTLQRLLLQEPSCLGWHSRPQALTVPAGTTAGTKLGSHICGER